MTSKHEGPYIALCYTGYFRACAMRMTYRGVFQPYVYVIQLYGSSYDCRRFLFYITYVNTSKVFVNLANAVARLNLSGDFFRVEFYLATLILIIRGLLTYYLISSTEASEYKVSITHFIWPIHFTIFRVIYEHRHEHIPGSNDLTSYLAQTNSQPSGPSQPVGLWLYPPQPHNYQFEVAAVVLKRTQLS